MCIRDRLRTTRSRALLRGAALRLRPACCAGGVLPGRGCVGGAGAWRGVQSGPEKPPEPPPSAPPPPPPAPAPPQPAPPPLPPASLSSLRDDPELLRTVGLLVGAQLMLNMGVSQVVPVIPIFAQQMGLGATGVGLLISAPSLARIVLNLPLGRLADTWGRVPLMRYGTLVTAAGAAGTGLMMPYGLAAVLPFRLLIGAGSAASMTGSTAYMADLTDRSPQHRVAIMGFQSTVLSAAWVVGPSIGGYLAEQWGARNAFYIAAVGVGLCSVGYSRLAETLRGGAADTAGSADSGGDREGSPPPPTAGGRDALWALSKDANVQALAALAGSTALAQGCFMSVVALHARHVFDAGAADLGFMFSLMGAAHVVGLPLGSWLGSRFEKKHVIVGGLLISNLCFAAIGAVDTRASFLAVMCASNLSGACTNPALGAFTAEALPKEARGQGMAITRMCSDVVGLGAPVALGLLADSTSCGAAIGSSAITMTGCTLYFLMRARDPSRR